MLFHYSVIASIANLWLLLFIRPHLRRVKGSIDRLIADQTQDQKEIEVSNPL